MRVAASDPRLRLLYVGPILDPGEGEALQRALAPRPWARHVGSVPQAQMASLLAQADVVLNCSVSEGGMANSVLEALALERAVLVSDIAGQPRARRGRGDGSRSSRTTPSWRTTAEAARSATPRCERGWAGPAGRSSSASIRSRGRWMATSARTIASASRSHPRERCMQTGQRRSGARCLFAAQCPRRERRTLPLEALWRGLQRGSGLTCSPSVTWKPRPP